MYVDGKEIHVPIVNPPEIAKTCATKLKLMGLHFQALQSLEEQEYDPIDGSPTAVQAKVQSDKSIHLDDSMNVNYDPLESGKEQTDTRDLETLRGFC